MIPEGQSGPWRVERFAMTPDRAKLSALRDRGRYCPAGGYTRLTRNGVVVMSDTPAEIRDLRSFESAAVGSVLITGLGLGIATSLALAKSEVSDVTVVECSPDVIALVAPHIACDRLTVIEADAYQWTPPRGRQWHAAWHDIWDDICADNLEGMRRLHRRYSRRAVWQGSWCRYECERARRAGS